MQKFRRVYIKRVGSNKACRWEIFFKKNKICCMLIREFRVLKLSRHSIPCALAERAKFYFMEKLFCSIRIWIIWPYFYEFCSFFTVFFLIQWRLNQTKGVSNLKGQTTIRWRPKDMIKSKTLENAVQLSCSKFGKGFLHKQITRKFCHNIHTKSQEGSLTKKRADSKKSNNMCKNFATHKSKQLQCWMEVYILKQ